MAKKPKPNPSTDALKDAVAFVSKAQRAQGAPYQCHARIMHGQIYAADGMLAAGSPIPVDLHACPHTIKLLKALERCDGNMTMTQTSRGLSIKSGTFQAHVPCISGDGLYQVQPDAPAWPIDDRAVKAMETVGILATENAEKLVMASVLVRGGTCVGTNRMVLLEAWHGNDLPRMIVPKAFVTALAAIKEPVERFGYAKDNSLTIHFTSKRWLKTQLFTDDWPDVDRLLNLLSCPQEASPAWFDAISKVEPFVDNGAVYFHSGRVWSDKDGAEAASVECAVVDTLMGYDPKHILQMRPFMSKTDLTSYTDKLLFVGDMVRGLIAGKE